MPVPVRGNAEEQTAEKAETVTHPDGTNSYASSLTQNDGLLVLFAQRDYLEMPVDSPYRTAVYCFSLSISGLTSHGTRRVSAIALKLQNSSIICLV